MIRSPYFDLWISTILGFSFALWPMNPWLWGMAISLLFARGIKKEIVIFIALAIFRANLEIAMVADFSPDVRPTYETAHSIPRELIVPVSNPVISKIRNFINDLLESPYSLLEGFRKAIVLGATRELPAQIWDSMNYLGLSHLLVISGSHITVILLFIVWAVRLGNKSRIYFLPRFIALVVVSLFLAIANRDLSIMRAFICFAVIALGGIWFPQLHRLRSSERLSLVGMIIAWISPLAVFQVTYALSFGTSWALLRSNELNGDGAKYLKFIAPFAIIFPLCGILNLSVHPLSVIANIVFGAVFLFALLSTSLISIVIVPLEFFSDFLIRHFFLSVQWTADFLARHGPSVSLSPEMNLILFLVVVFIFQLKNELPILRFKYLLAIFSVACLFYFVPPVWKTFFNRKGVDIQVLDIGQGDGLLLRVDGKKIAIDGGGPRLGARQLLPEIQKYFGGRIDLWVFSHFDQDHRGNFGEIEARLSIGKIWVPRLDGSTFSKMLRAQHRESLIIGQNELLEFSTEKHSWNCVSVNEAIAYVKVGNDDSLSCALSNRKTHDILFVSTGDLPSRLEPKVLDAFTQMGLKVPENGIMVLKLGHHGSKTSSSGIFLDGLRPQIGIITAGRQNQYRFPHEPVLERLLSRGVRVFRVDALGNFKVHFDN